MQRIILGAALVAGVVVSSLACGPVDGVTDAEGEAATGAALTASRPAPTTSFVVTRRDARECVGPSCGGFYVRAVNQLTTRCFDGTSASECYVGAIDDAALNLSGKARVDFMQALESGRNFADGVFQAFDASHPDVAKLVLSEGYDNRTTGGTYGDFVHVRYDASIVCPPIPQPCARFRVRVLNHGWSESLYTHLVWTTTFPEPPDAAKIGAMLNADGIYARVIYGYGSGVPKLYANAAYVPVRVALPLCMNDDACGAGQACDTTACHSNCPPGAICPAVCWGVCRPLRYCMNAQACEAGEVCDMSTCHSPCAPGVECPAVCWGVCGRGDIE